MGILDSVTNDPAMNNAVFQKKMQEANASRFDTQLENLKGLKGKEGVDKAAQGFSSMMIFQLLKDMRKTVPKESLFGGNSYAMDVFTSMLDEKIANRVAQRESMGITKMLKQYLNKRYENSSDPGQEKDIKSPAINKKVISFENTTSPADSTGKVKQYDPIINKVAQEVKLDPDLIRAVIAKESGGNSLAVSKRGAKGLMQLMDETAKELGVSDSLDPEENIRGGAAYLKKMLIKFEGDLPKALAAYNAGPGAVRVYNGIPPYPETRRYIDSVIKMQEQFRKGEQI